MTPIANTGRLAAAHMVIAAYLAADFWSPRSTPSVCCADQPTDTTDLASSSVSLSPRPARADRRRGRARALGYSNQLMKFAAIELVLALILIVPSFTVLYFLDQKSMCKRKGTRH